MQLSSSHVQCPESTHGGMAGPQPAAVWRVCAITVRYCSTVLTIAQQQRNTIRIHMFSSHLDSRPNTPSCSTITIHTECTCICVLPHAVQWCTYATNTTYHPKCMYTSEMLDVYLTLTYRICTAQYIHTYIRWCTATYSNTYKILNIQAKVKPSGGSATTFTRQLY